MDSGRIGEMSPDISDQMAVNDSSRQSTCFTGYKKLIRFFGVDLKDKEYHRTLGSL